MPIDPVSAAIGIMGWSIPAAMIGSILSWLNINVTSFQEYGTLFVFWPVLAVVIPVAYLFTVVNK